MPLQKFFDVRNRGPFEEMGALLSRGPRVQLNDDVLVLILAYVKQSGLNDGQFYKYRGVCQQWRKVVEHLSRPRCIRLCLVPLPARDGSISTATTINVLEVLYYSDRKKPKQPPRQMKISDLRYFPRAFPVSLVFYGNNLHKRTLADSITDVLHNILVAGPKQLELHVPYSCDLVSFRKILRCSAVSMVTNLSVWLQDVIFQEIFCKCLPSFSRLQVVNISIENTFYPYDCLVALERLSAKNLHLKQIRLSFGCPSIGAQFVHVHCIAEFLQALTTHGKPMTVSLWTSALTVRELYAFPFGKNTTSMTSDLQRRWITADQQVLEMTAQDRCTGWDVDVVILPSSKK
uniref:F-box domain-containing protein n=1 Tax=Steinernema glaseri TaxID=37863 RepID=A0A1I7XZ97_9BILA